MQRLHFSMSSNKKAALIREMILAPSTRFIAQRAASLPQSSTVALADIASAMRARGETVIDLSAGRAVEATAPEICDVAKRALDEGDTHQTPARGTPAYLEAISAKLARENDLSYAAESGVMATLGCKNGLVLTLMSILDPGDEVIIEDPCFVSYAPTIALCGGRAVPAPLEAKDGYRWRGEQLERAVSTKTKAILFCSPHNPLGVVHSATDLEEIARVARTHDLIVIADEIYEAVTWGNRRHTPISSLPGMAERTVGLMGMTKAYAMGGWRIGYAYGPDDLIAQMTRTQAHFMTSASSIAQRAGAAALSAAITEDLRGSVWREWEARCVYLSGALNDISGLSCTMPEGGYYAWLDVRQTGLSSEAFCEGLLHQHGIVTVPGDSFGAHGAGFVRVTCVKSMDEIRMAAERITEFVRSR